MSRAKSSVMYGKESVLHTKLMPPRLRSFAIPREELMRRLDSGLNGKLILLSAPTGFGKTTFRSLLDKSDREIIIQLTLFTE